MKPVSNLLHKVALCLALLLLLGAGLIITKAAPAAASPKPPDGLAQGAQPLSTVDTLTMPAVNVPALLAEDEQRAAEGLPSRFAQPIAVQLDPQNAGTWETLADGSQLWRLRIISAKAISLNFGFTRYQMPVGGRLYLYTADYSHVVGPFSELDNETHGQLWSPLVMGDDVVIEVTLPAGTADRLELQLTSINHGYAEFGRSHVPMSGSCNVDVVCPEGDGWRDEIRSVAVISTGGSTFCTGFLVNNTAQDLTPYFMTANHCDINAGNAASLVTYWNYENSTCRVPGSPASGGPGDGTLDQYNTGSYFRSASSASDFTLVELDDPINPDFNVHWAGWDRTSGDSTSAVAIHHPATDEKRISFENDPTTTTSYLGTSIPGDGTHVRITDWDLGTTEPGSSGSPLFNQDHRVVGQLHGGYAACGNDDSDWYGRFSVSWTGGGTPATRLSNWLDPENTGADVLDGRDLIESSFTLDVAPTSLAVCAPDTALYTVTLQAEVPGFNQPVTLDVNGEPAGTLALFSVNPLVTPTVTSLLTISNTASGAAGSYALDVTGQANTQTFTATVGLDLYTDIPNLSVLVSPADGAVDQSPQPVFEWNGAPFSNGYNFRLGTSPLFETPLVITTGLTTSEYQLASPLEGGRCYWWSVQSANACGAGEWAEPFHFATANLAVSFFDNVESGSGNWSHQAAQGVDHWAVSTAQSYSPSHAWFVPDDSVVTDSWLRLANPITVGGGSTLSFWHRYAFEGDGYDGSVLEISTDGGTTWVDLGPHITTNGYNGVIDNGYSNPLMDLPAWVGDLTAWTQVEVDLSSYAGQSILVRWRIGCDSSQGDTGWYIDDVTITSPLPSAPAPTLIGVTPDTGSTYEDTPVVISGTNFVDTPAIQLGETWLMSVTMVNTNTLTAVVPAGIPGGVYTMTLYNGDCQEIALSGAFTVTEIITPIVGLTATNDGPTPLGEATHLSASVEEGSPVYYTWAFGDDTLGSGASADHVYPAVGVYTAVVTATNSANTLVTHTLVTVLDVPIAGLEASSNSPVILGTQMQFTATITAGTNVAYSWDFGDNSPAGSGITTTHLYTATGSYTVTVTASNSEGSVQVELQVEVISSGVTWEVYLPQVVR